MTTARWVPGPASKSARAPTARASSGLVSVIIPNWNRCDLLAECLAALERQTYDPFETIVVDNGSTDGSAERVRARSGPRLRLISDAENLGYARAVNQGIAAASGELVATLNNDAVPDPGWIAALAEAAGRAPEIGMVASKILSFDDPRVLDGTGLLLYPDGSSRARGRLEEDRGQYDACEEALLPSGCAALYRRAMLDDVGLHDEAFFAYCEDTDLGLRGRLGGWRCAFAPKALVRHRYSASSGHYSATKAYLVERNRLWVAAKNFPADRLLASPFFTLARYAVQAYGALSGRGAAGRFARETSRGALAGTLLRAQRDALRGLPAALRKRRANRVRVAREEIDRWFREFGIGVRELALKD
jgi:GT2 family glycosyltransferase